MVLRLDSDWDQLDIQNLPALSGQRVSTSLYDRLVGYGAGGKVVPYLAKSWKATPQSVIFNLRTDATCADGTPITPTVVANSFKRYFSSLASKIIFGPGQYSVAADDAAGTFTVTLGTPNSDMPKQFVQPTTGIVCPAGLANPSRLVDTPAGSGPFVLQSASHGDNLTLKARPNWQWGPYGVTSKTAGFPDTLIYRVVTNDTTAANQLLTGGLDVATFGGPETKRLVADKSLHQQPVRQFYNFPMEMNEDPRRPTSDESVREALMTAVDPKGWNQAANGGFGTTGTSLFTTGMDCFDPSTAKLMPQPNPDKAKSILLADGYSVGANGMLQKGGKPLTIVVVTDTIYGSGPEYLAEQFRKTGITVDLQVLESIASRTRTNSGDFDVTIGQLGAPVPAPSYNIRFLTSAPPPVGSNTSRINDPTLVGEVNQALGTEGSERCQHWSNVQRRLLEKRHLLPLASPEAIWFTRRVQFVSQIAILEAASLKRSA